MPAGKDQARNVATLIGVCACAGLGYFLTSRSSQPAPMEWEPSAVAKPVKEKAVPTTVTVHIKGHVASPGVYSFPADTRLKQAIQIAKPLSNADLTLLNLAAKLQDGSQIVISKRGPTAIATRSSSQSRATYRPSRISGDLAPLPLASPMPSEYVSETARKVPTEKSRASGKKQPPAEPIDINTASAETLMQIPGIGPATAQLIIEYRHAHGGFATADELLKVKGIGPKKFDQMRAYIRI
jgi:competence protein ComEA